MGMIFFGSCHPNDEEVTRKDFTTDVPVSDFVKKQSYPVPFILVPSQLLNCGEYFIASDRNADTVFHLFKISNGKVVDLPYFKRGANNDEILSATNIFSKDDTNFFVYDLTKASIVKFNIDSSELAGDIRGSFVYKMDSIDRSCYSPLFLNDSIIVSPHFKNNNKRLTFVNLSNGDVYESGGYVKHEKKAPLSIIAQSYQCVILKSDSVLILANRLTDKVEVRGLDGELKYYLSGPIGHEAVYKVASTIHGPVMKQGRKRKITYIDCAAADGKLYLLFMGENPDDHINQKEPNPLLKKTIASEFLYVVDLATGNLTKKIKLDEKAYCISINKKSRQLFTISTGRTLNVYNL